MTEPVQNCSADIARLADEWQAESKKHALAALEGDCDVGDDEWCLHRESARIYRKCADQLVTAVSRGILSVAQAVGMREALIEQCAKIAEPWSGFMTGDKMGAMDSAIVEVREEIAAAIRSLASQPSPAATVEARCDNCRIILKPNEVAPLCERCRENYPALARCSADSAKLTEVLELIEYQRRRYQDVRLNFKQMDLLLSYVQPQAALIMALQDIAGDDEPRPMLDGTTAENLRNIARRALAVSRPHGESSVSSPAEAAPSQRLPE